MRMTHPNGGDIEVRDGDGGLYESAGWLATPKGNGPLAEWQAFADLRGLDHEGMTRDEIRDALS